MPGSISYMFLYERKTFIPTSALRLMHRAHQCQLPPMDSRSTHPLPCEQPSICCRSSYPLEACLSCPCSCSKDKAVSNLVLDLNPTMTSAGYSHVKQRLRKLSSRPCSPVSYWQRRHPSPTP